MDTSSMKTFTTRATIALAFSAVTMFAIACQSEHGQHGSKHGEQGEKEHSDTELGAKKHESKEAHEDEVKMALAQAPEAVRNAFAELAPGASAVTVERSTEDDSTIFEIEYTSGGEKATASVTEGGEVLEIERVVTTLPDAVKRAIEKSMPGAKVVKSESVQTFRYEVVVEKDGKQEALEIAPNGEMDEEDED